MSASHGSATAHVASSGASPLLLSPRSPSLSPPHSLLHPPHSLPLHLPLSSSHFLPPFLSPPYLSPFFLFSLFPLSLLLTYSFFHPSLPFSLPPFISLSFSLSTPFFFLISSYLSPSPNFSYSHTSSSLFSLHYHFYHSLLFSSSLYFSHLSIPARYDFPELQPRRPAPPIVCAPSSPTPASRPSSTATPSPRQTLAAELEAPCELPRARRPARPRRIGGWQHREIQLGLDRQTRRRDATPFPVIPVLLPACSPTTSRSAPSWRSTPGSTCAPASTSPSPCSA